MKREKRALWKARTKGPSALQLCHQCMRQRHRERNGDALREVRRGAQLFISLKRCLWCIWREMWWVSTLHPTLARKRQNGGGVCVCWRTCRSSLSSLVDYLFFFGISFWIQLHYLYVLLQERPVNCFLARRSFKLSAPWSASALPLQQLTRQNLKSFL